MKKILVPLIMVILLLSSVSIVISQQSQNTCRIEGCMCVCNTTYCPFHPRIRLHSGGNPRRLGGSEWYQYMYCPSNQCDFIFFYKVERPGSFW